MSAIVVLTPALIAAWPTVCASVVGAAGALGFAQVSGLEHEEAVPISSKSVDLKVGGSDMVTGALSVDETLSFERDGVQVTFSRDARGHCGVNVSGTGHDCQQLEAVGREFAEQVVQQYAYHRLMTELQAKGFNVVEQEVGEDRTIHVQVRRHA